MGKDFNVRFPEDIADRLANLAMRTKRTKSFYVKEIITQYLDEYEDICLASERLNNKHSRYYSTEEVEKRLGL